MPEIIIVSRTLPREYGIHNHDIFREGQLDSINFIRDSVGSKEVLLEAPVGSGKSAVGAALGWGNESVRVLTKTKSLQAQYSDYDFEVLFGMANYDCAEFPMFDARFCSHTANMYNCPHKEICTYLIRRERTKEHNRQALSYAYYLQAKWPKMNPTDYLYCDEAHEIPNMVMSYTTLSLSLKDISDIGIGRWPTRFSPPADSLKKKTVVKWLRKSAVQIDAAIDKYKRLRKKIPNLARKVMYLKGVHERFSRVASSLEVNPRAFAMEITNESIRIVPLTARNDFKYLFNTESKLILTSATIGNPNEFAYSLGINKFDAREVPSNFPAAAMPIYVPADAPRMNYSTSDSGRAKQAIIIKDMIGECDPSWNGLIHTSSKWQANDLANRLARMGLQDRVWVTPEKTGTDEKIRMWDNQLERTPNTICLSWAFHEGIDRPGCHINILAKIPFGPLDGLGKVKKDYDPRFYGWQAAIMAMQATGRNRRGEPEHYEEVGQPMRKFVAIADASVWSLKKFYSDHFKQCLTKV